MTAAEAEGGRPVCVIGNDVATNLFQHESPLGKKISIGARRLEVVGVLEKRGSFWAWIASTTRSSFPSSSF